MPVYYAHEALNEEEFAEAFDLLNAVLAYSHDKSIRCDFYEINKHWIKVKVFEEKDLGAN